MRPSTSRGLRSLNNFLAQRTASINTCSAASTRLLSTQRRARLISALIPSSRLQQRQRIPTSTLFPRYNSSQSSGGKPLTDRKSTTDPEEEVRKKERHDYEDAYRIVFTCTPCGHRSGHRMSKQGYHRGTVLIQCPSCHTRHIMSDHLGIFFDQSTTLEDILKNKGQTLTHGHTDGNLEFLEDGTVRQSSSQPEEELFSKRAANNDSEEKPT